jgi:aryl-alcohol dehydrogenase-like predicted oxidoreductase
MRKKKLYSEIAKKKGVSLEKLALDFILQKEKVDTVLF